MWSRDFPGTSSWCPISTRTMQRTRRRCRESSASSSIADGLRTIPDSASPISRTTASFGIGDAGEFQIFPELYFNLILDRNFAGPFFEYLVFAIAVAFLLFGLLALTTDDENLKGRFQLSTAGVLAAASGLLFAVILKHNQIRSGVGTQGLSYIETIPIILYGIIVVVVLNAILLASPLNARLIRHRNNLIPTLAYWPVVLGLLLAVTLIVFFRR